MDLENTTGFDSIPARYTLPDGKEVIDIIREKLEATYGAEGFIAFCAGNAMKYEFRAGKKGDAATDIEKANFYKQFMLHVTYGLPDPRTYRNKHGTGS